ncbi:hypothetical protein [Parvularcula dongshanensis]|uniref:Lipoprotein n=1 Tax=Parvularcula dongshanensis TaxID=1173995 RepID=A0A840I2R0_9PROT|nr:hypothetical protein [Parvularcula dongshanensis]MBB4658582.1 hypothetical protein [Parvularcula dongshanensis]
MGFGTRRVLAAGLALTASACASSTVRPPAPVAIDTLTYSNAISQARQEQLLLNIVRLRYDDPVTFVDVERMTTQDRTSYRGGLSSAIPLDGNPLNEVLSGNIGGDTSSQPTVVYNALRGKDFAQQLLQPLPPASIFLLSQSGWSVERLLLCCVARIGNVDNARVSTGPSSEVLPNNVRFRQLASLMRTLQDSDRLLAQVIDAEEAGGDPRVILKWDRGVREGQALAEFLTKNWAADVVPMSGNRYMAEITTRGNMLGDFAVRGRSLLGVMSALSKTVAVPVEHESLVGTSARADLSSHCTAPPPWDEVTGGYFAVMSSKTKPDTAAVAVPYRGYWFYVDDRCHAAKSTLTLVDHLYALQAGISNGATTLLLLGG